MHSPATHPERTGGECPPHRDRRREKPQLSCNFCRRRKVKCDRQLPCDTCVNKGIARACTYAPDAPTRKGPGSVGERIQQLEALVRSLVQDQRQSPQASAPHSNYEPQGSPSGPVSGQRPELSAAPSPQSPSRSSNSDTVGQNAVHSPFEHGTVRVHSHGSNYIGGFHWAAILDSISELKEHYQKEFQERRQSAQDSMPSYSPSPRLLYEPVSASKAEILASIPARPVVDRMIARYFKAQGIAPTIVHSGQFIREYEAFWQAPESTSFAWIGLLFSIMCLSTQAHQKIEISSDIDASARIHLFRERTVHCLNLAAFTKGGAHVMEALFHHCTSETQLHRDSDAGIWLLLGVLVHFALSQGYHRDPQHFPNISPFAGEMRRRIWAAIVQTDLRLSSQMGMPRIIKSHEYDTAEPRNLLDSDFDENTIELPPSRPETEITPALYTLARSRIDSINGLISDFVADTRARPYAEVMELDAKLQGLEETLPPIFRWQPLSQSLMVPPEIVLQRILLKLAAQGLAIWLHRKYLAPPHAELCTKYSRATCVQAAIVILELQQMIEDETKPEGQLYGVRYLLSARMQSIYLLGVSVLCYYIQLTKSCADVPNDEYTIAKIHSLLRETYPLWVQSSTVSRDAREAVDHLSLLLGLQEPEENTLSFNDAATHYTLPSEVPFPFDQVSWEIYQDCLAGLPALSEANSMALPGSEFLA